LKELSRTYEYKYDFEHSPDKQWVKLTVITKKWFRRGADVNVSWWYLPYLVKSGAWNEIKHLVRV
jgi:hypothetical protein